MNEPVAPSPQSNTCLPWFARGYALAVKTVVLLALAGASGHLRAASSTLSSVADTTLFQTLPDNNLGAEPTLISGSTSAGQANRALLKFNIASNLPPDAAVQSVTLTVKVTRTVATLPSSFRLHRVLRDWGEGIGRGTGISGGNTGAAAKNGEATWRARFFPDVLWSMPGAAPPADFVERASATQSIDGFGSYVFTSSAELVADVQNWLSNPSSNFGWILICDDEATASTARRFGSREDPANAASLAVEYGPALRMEQAAVVGNTFKFSFTAQAGQGYLGQSTDSLPNHN